MASKIRVKVKDLSSVAVIASGTVLGIGDNVYEVTKPSQAQIVLVVEDEKSEIEIPVRKMGTMARWYNEGDF